MDCPQCRVANPESSRFCSSCGAALTGACPSCGAATAPGARFCGQCGKALQGTPDGGPRPAAGPERRQITVLFSDLVGSTVMSRHMDPEDLRDVIRDYQDACRPVIERFGGFVARYVGDGILVYFGYPQAHEDDAERAVHAALGIIAGVRGLSGYKASGKPAVRIGIATGVVVAGDLIGQGAAEQQAVVGETPNLAARLQGLADPDTVVIDSATHRLAGRLFRYEDLGGQELKGFETPVAAYRVLGEDAEASRFEAIRSPIVAPLVGRDAELAQLRERWRLAAQGHGQVVLLSGEAGMGKSRLAQALVEAIAGEPHARLRYQCSPHHGHSALYPVISQIERGVRFAADDDDAARLAKVERFLAPAPERRDEVVPLIAALLSVPTQGAYPPLDLSPQRQKARTLSALLDMLEREARPAPLALLIEDAHWIDPTSRELLDMIVSWAKAVPVLVIVTTRPGEAPPWAGESHVANIALGRLDARECAELVPGVAGGRRIPRAIIERIVARTDGIPLFVEELTRTLDEAGLLAEAGDNSAGGRELADSLIPSTLQASLLARLDNLGWAKDLAQIGAAIGREFSDDLLAEVADLPRARLDAGLQALQEANLVQRVWSSADPEVRYSFRHALVQDAAYESMLRRRRQALHGQIGRALEARSEGAGGAHAVALARHFTEAGIADRAVHYWQKAGEWAIARSADADAIAHLNRGISLLERIPEGPERNRRELDLKVALTVPLTAVKGYVAPEVEQIVTRARVLCDELDDQRQRFVSVHALYRYYVVRARHRTAADHSEELLGLARESGQVGDLLEAHKSLALSLTYLGEFAAARRHAEQAIALYDPGAHRAHAFVYGTDPAVISYSYLAHCLWFMGYPDQALAMINEATARGRTVSHPFSEVFGVLNAATLHVFRGDLAALHERAAEGVRISTEQGFPFWLGWAGALMGYVLGRTKSAEAGLPLIQRTLDGFKAAGVGFGRPLCLALLAETHQRAGNLEPALAAVREGLAETEAEGYMYRAELFRLQGELLLAQGESNREAALASFDQALDVARRQQGRSLELRTATSLARVLARQGHRDAARTTLRAVHETFTEGFDTPDLRDAQACLQEIAA